MNTSLLHGPLPIVVMFGAFGALAVAVGLDARRRYLSVLGLAAGSVLTVVIIGSISGIEHRLGSSFPKSFFVWAALPVFAGAVAVTGWRHMARARRAASAVAVLLLLVFGAGQVNAHYAYNPTLGDALGRPIARQIATSEIPGPRSLGATPSLVASRGAVVSIAIPGTRSGFVARKALVWLPPAYFTDRMTKLPVMMLLAGVPGDPSNMIRAGHADRWVEAFAATHDGRAPILVMPDHNGHFTGDSECVDGPRGNVETYLTVDVPRFVEARFDTSSSGSQWGIIGFSEGGTCAITLALRHPDSFGAFVDIAGDAHPSVASGRRERELTIRRLYAGDARQWASHDNVRLLAAGPGKITGRIIVGDHDHHAMAAAARLAEAARDGGNRLPVMMLPGGHSFDLVSRALSEEVPWMASRLLGSPEKTAPSADVVDAPAVKRVTSVGRTRPA